MTFGKAYLSLHYRTFCNSPNICVDEFERSYVLGPFKFINSPIRFQAVNR